MPVDVDYVCVVDEIGDPAKIASNVIRMTQDVRELKMAEDCARVMAATPYFRDGFSFQTGGGGASLACSAETQTRVDHQVVALVKKEHAKAVGILTENRAKLDELAKYLYEKETITGEEFMAILNRT